MEKSPPLAYDSLQQDTQLKTPSTEERSSTLTGIAGVKKSLNNAFNY